MNFASIPNARCLLAAALWLGAAAASAQPAAAPAAGASAAVAASAAAGGAEPYGIALEGLAYPHPVHLLPLDWDGLALRMAYMDVPPAGASNGETVLLMHGRNFPSSYWEGTIAALSGAGFRVVVPDQIHFGKSSKPDDRPASFDVMAAHTAALLDHLKLPAVHVVAHSMGGMAAMRFTRTFPARVKRLVLEAPVGLEDYRRYVPPVPRERLLAQEMALTPEGYLDQLMNTYRPQLPRERMRAYADVRARTMGSAEYPRWVRSYVSSYYAMWGQPVVHEMPLIAPADADRRRQPRPHRHRPRLRPARAAREDGRLPGPRPRGGGAHAVGARRGVRGLRPHAAPGGAGALPPAGGGVPGGEVGQHSGARVLDLRIRWRDPAACNGMNSTARTVAETPGGHPVSDPLRTL